MTRFGVLLLMLFTFQVSAAPPQKSAVMPMGPDAKTPKYITFDAPHAGKKAMQGTVAISINTAGAITGDYVADSDPSTHAFVRSADGTTISEFDSPHAGKGQNQGTFSFGINTKGVVTGMYADSTDAYHGFVRSADGKTITEFDAPGAGTSGHRGTNPLSINAKGTIAGNYDTGSAQTVTHWHGFVRTAKGVITSFDAPGAGTGDKQGTAPPVAINAKGVITGTYTDSRFVHHGYIRDAKGGMTTFDAPGAGNAPGPFKGLQFQGTIPVCINTAGVVAGVYADSSFVVHAFVRATDGSIQAFDAPGAGGSGTFGTVAFSINTAGVIAGVYQDNNGVVHGYSRAVNGTLTVFDAPGAGGNGFLPGTGAFSLNTKGNIVGGFSDSNNVYHGYLRTPK